MVGRNVAASSAADKAFRVAVEVFDLAPTLGDGMGEVLMSDANPENDRHSTDAIATAATRGLISWAAPVGRMLNREMGLRLMRYLISYGVPQSERKPEEVTQATTGAPGYRQQAVTCLARPPSSTPLGYHLQSPPSQNSSFISTGHM
jgi:hypothetical protein